MEVLLILAVGFVCCACLLIGVNVGQKVSKGEEVKMPSVNPMEAYKEQKARNRAEREQRRQDTIMQNIDNYNGTAEGQKDVPEG